MAVLHVEGAQNPIYCTGFGLTLKIMIGFRWLDWGGWDWGGRDLGESLASRVNAIDPYEIFGLRSLLTRKRGGLYVTCTSHYFARFLVLGYGNSSGIPRRDFDFFLR